VVFCDDAYGSILHVVFAGALLITAGNEALVLVRWVGEWAELASWWVLFRVAEVSMMTQFVAAGIYRVKV
jgi:hypothetical protein